MVACEVYFFCRIGVTSYPPVTKGSPTTLPTALFWSLIHLLGFISRHLVSLHNKNKYKRRGQRPRFMTKMYPLLLAWDLWRPWSKRFSALPFCAMQVVSQAHRPFSFLSLQLCYSIFFLYLTWAHLFQLTVRKIRGQKLNIWHGPCTQSV